MPNTTSLKRSNELTIKAQPFLDYKTEYYSKLNKTSKDVLLKYYNVSENEWNNWEWQLKNRVTNVEQLKDIFSLLHYEYEQILKVSNKYRFAVTPYYLSLIREFNKNDPIYLQCIPQSDELNTDGELDPMKESDNNPAGAITRRYPDRLIINVTNCCASFCRHCQRRRNIGERDIKKSDICLEESYKYIKDHSEIRDVLITGGDPFTLSDLELDKILFNIRSIRNVEIIRIGTRTLVTMPQRITDELIYVLKKYGPIYVNTQFNHPTEITEDSIAACLKLTDNGIVLGNQTVFLKNINTNPYTLQLLNQQLLKSKIRPYYIFHPKRIAGTKHFSISLAEGIKIYDKLRGNTSGLAIPTYILNANNGLGKIVLNRDILKLADENGNVTLETWEGDKFTTNIWNIY